MEVPSAPLGFIQTERVTAVPAHVEVGRGQDRVLVPSSTRLVCCWQADESKKNPVLQARQDEAVQIAQLEEQALEQESSPVTPFTVG